MIPGAPTELLLRAHRTGEACGIGLHTSKLWVQLVVRNRLVYWADGVPGLLGPMGRDLPADKLKGELMNDIGVAISAGRSVQDVMEAASTGLGLFLAHIADTTDATGWLEPGRAPPEGSFPLPESLLRIFARGLREVRPPERVEAELRGDLNHLVRATTPNEDALEDLDAVAIRTLRMVKQPKTLIELVLSSGRLQAERTRHAWRAIDLLLHLGLMRIDRPTPVVVAKPTPPRPPPSPPSRTPPAEPSNSRKRSSAPEAQNPDHARTSFRAEAPKADPPKLSRPSEAPEPADTSSRAPDNARTSFRSDTPAPEHSKASSRPAAPDPDNARTSFRSDTPAPDHSKASSRPADPDNARTSFRSDTPAPEQGKASSRPAAPDNARTSFRSDTPAPDNTKLSFRSEPPAPGFAKTSFRSDPPESASTSYRSDAFDPDNARTSFRSDTPQRKHTPDEPIAPYSRDKNATVPDSRNVPAGDASQRRELYIETPATPQVQMPGPWLRQPSRPPIDESLAIEAEEDTDDDPSEVTEEIELEASDLSSSPPSDANFLNMSQVRDGEEAAFDPGGPPSSFHIEIDDDDDLATPQPVAVVLDVAAMCTELNPLAALRLSVDQLDGILSVEGLRSAFARESGRYKIELYPSATPDVLLALESLAEVFRANREALRDPAILALWLRGLRAYQPNPRIPTENQVRGARTRFEEAQRFAWRRDWDRALEAALAARRIDPTQPRYRLLVIFCSVCTRRITATDGVLNIDSLWLTNPTDQALAQVTAGRLLKVSGKPALAQARFRNALKLDPNRADAQKELAALER